MFVHYRTQGIILKKEDRGEANQLFTIYTKDFGKLEIFGKAIRKISSKLRAGADVFYLTDIEFIQGKAHKTLTDAVLIEKFENIRSDLNKLKIAYQISEILDELIKGQEPDEEIWDLLNKTFQRLNNLKLKTPHQSRFRRDGAGLVQHRASLWCWVKNWKLIYYYFLWDLLSLLGYEPQLYNCAICQKKLIPEKFYFNPKEGGVICTQCSKKIEKTTTRPPHPRGPLGGRRESWSPAFGGPLREIKIETIKIIRILLKKDWPTIKRLKIGPEDLKGLRMISNYFLGYIKKEVSGNN